jgi:hypothetical protein
VSAVDGATHAQKDGTEGNRRSLKDVAGIIVLLLCGAQMDLR